MVLRFYPEKTKIIFFDLEFYVPREDRNRRSPSGMIFCPVLPGHKILGGTFSTYHPMQDRIVQRHSFWEWREGSERNVLSAIFELLQREWKSIEDKEQAGSLMLSGIGIAHSDIPALAARLSSLSIGEQERIYDVIYGCRQIDLSTATFCQFSFKHEYFAYPKGKSALYQKYLSGKRLESGKSVWESYEDSNYEAIETRNSDEVSDAISIYKTMFDLKREKDADLKAMKRFKKENQKGSGRTDGDQLNDA